MPARQPPHGPPGAVPRPSAHLIARSGARDPSMTRNRPDAVNEQGTGVQLLNGASGSPEERVSIRVPVNGQVAVSTGGQLKVSTPRVDHGLFGRAPPRARASRMR